MTEASSPLIPSGSRIEDDDELEPSHNDAEIARRLEEGLSPNDVVDFEVGGLHPAHDPAHS